MMQKIRIIQQSFIFSMHCKHSIKLHTFYKHFLLNGVETTETLQTTDSDTVSIYQISSVQLVTNKKLKAFDKA